MQDEVLKKNNREKRLGSNRSGPPWHSEHGEKAESSRETS